MMKQPTFVQVESWCLQHGWSDPFWHENSFWAFPPGAVMPCPVPLPDADKQQRDLAAQPNSSLGRRRSGLQHLFNPWTVSMIGVILLAVSDPKFPGTLPGLPPIPRGLAYAQFLVLEGFLLQAFLWVQSVKRGEFRSLRGVLFTLILLVILGSFKGE